MIHTLIVSVVVCLVSAAGEPGVFSDDGYEADRAAAIEQERLHLVYAFREDSRACEAMTGMAWVFPQFVAWLEQNAVVTPLDVATHAEVARQHEVVSVPTLIPFSEGRVQRSIGAKEGMGLLSWLATFHSGEELSRKRTEFVDQPGWSDQLYEQVLRLLALRDRLWLNTERSWPRAWLDDNELERLMRARFEDDPCFTPSDRALWLMRTGDLFLRDPTDWARVGANSLQRYAASGEITLDDARFLRDVLEYEVRSAGKRIRLDDWSGELQLALEPVETWVHLNRVLDEDHRTLDWARALLEDNESAFAEMRLHQHLADTARLHEDWWVFSRLFPDVEVDALEIATQPHRWKWGSDSPSERVVDRAKEALGTEFKDIFTAALVGDDPETISRVVSIVSHYLGDQVSWREELIRQANELGVMRDEWRSWITEGKLKHRASAIEYLLSTETQ
ncbi:MAG: hypothetical protein AAF937_03185 [Planctomycetota bacterium]